MRQCGSLANLKTLLDLPIPRWPGCSSSPEAFALWELYATEPVGSYLRVIPHTRMYDSFLNDSPIMFAFGGSRVPLSRERAP